MQEQNSLETIVEEYIQALEDRDFARCMDFYREDAQIKFHLGHYQGKENIERWHRDRFDADMRVVRIDKIKADGENKVVLKGAATSKKLKAWKIKDLSGTMTFFFEEGKIKEVKFGMRLYNPLEGW